MTAINITPTYRHAGHQLTAAAARERMMEYVRKGVANATRVVENVMNVVPQDAIVPAKEMDFRLNEAGRVEYFAPGRTGGGTLHRNAVQQLAGRLDIPVPYLDNLAERGEWGKNLLMHNMREVALRSEDRYLVRSVGGEARAVLSDAFRRIDCRPVAAALIEVAQTRKMVVADGVFTDTRTSLKFIDPQPIEVFPGEWMVFGMDWSNSDYGRGANDLRTFLFRLLCWNGAVGESVVRQIHIGKRLSDDVKYSEETLRLDSLATTSALKDAASAAVGEAKVLGLIEGVKAANETDVNVKTRAEALRTRLTKGDVEKVVETFNTGGIEQLPPGNSLWRWSNAISWVAGQLGDDQADKKIDLERLAGEVLRPAMPKAEAAA